MPTRNPRTTYGVKGPPIFDVIHGQYAWSHWLFGSPEWPLEVTLEIVHLDIKGTGSRVRTTGASMQLDIPYLDLRKSAWVSPNMIARMWGRLDQVIDVHIEQELKANARKSLQTPLLVLHRPDRFFRESILFRAVSALTNYQRDAPTAVDWPSVRRLDQCRLHPHQLQAVRDLLKSQRVPVLYDYLR